MFGQLYVLQYPVLLAEGLGKVILQTITTFEIFNTEADKAVKWIVIEMLTGALQPIFYNIF